MWTWAAFAALLAGCAHLPAPTPAPASCVGQYAFWEVRDTYPLPPGFKVKRCLQLFEDGTYARECPGHIYEPGERRVDGRWVVAPGGVRVAPFEDGTVVTQHNLTGTSHATYVVFVEEERVFLVGYRWARKACAARTPPELAGLYARLARRDDAQLPSFRALCSTL